MAVRSGKGDEGFTELSFHRRLSKDSDDIAAIGDLDELGAYLGLVKCKIRSRKDGAVLERIQLTLSSMASEIVVSAEKRKKLGFLIKKEDEDWIKGVAYALEEAVRTESCFVLSGSNEISALLDVARTVARRAERSIVRIFRKGKLRNAHILTYLNCVSDILFIMARKRATGRGKKGLSSPRKRERSLSSPRKRGNK